MHHGLRLWRVVIQSRLEEPPIMRPFYGNAETSAPIDLCAPSSTRSRTSVAHLYVINFVILFDFRISVVGCDGAVHHHQRESGL